MPEQRLIVFLKAPRPGTVKTRLAERIGADAACEAYCLLVQTLLRRLGRLKQVELRFTPDDAAAEIWPWLTKQGWYATPQGAGDLGRRLRRAFEQAFSNGARRVVVIGSDCPDVSTADIEAAWSALSETDVALGPAHDGGYWLIGLRQLQPKLFQNISWSSETVLRETLARAEAARLRVKLLRQLTDVDTEGDWRAFAGS